MLEEIEARMQAARSGERPMSLEELEELYTSGCAEVLQLEAGAARNRRRISELREELRHVRTAIEWLQEEGAAR
jgi:chromosome segregation ATPase